MTTSGTFNYAPATAVLGQVAFGRIGVRRTELTASHMEDMRQAANLLLSEISNIQPNLWTVALTTTALVQGTATYNVSPEIVTLLDVYISTGTNPVTDRIIFGVSRSEYAAYPVKTQQGTPTVFWFDRLIAPTVTLWPVPDGNGPYTLKYYSVRQVQDANLANGETPEIPYRWLEAFTAGLAWKLSEIYAPDREDKMFARYDRAIQLARTQDTENVPLNIMPQLQGYWR